MKIEFITPTQNKTPVLIIPIFEGQKLATDFDAKAIKAYNFTGKDGQMVSFMMGGFLTYLFGAGKKDEKKLDLFLQELGGKIASFIKTLPQKTVSVCACGLKNDKTTTASAAAHLAYGLGLGSYCFDEYKSEKKDSHNIQIVSKTATDDEKAFQTLFAIMDGIYEARDLISEPANMLSPADFVEAVKEMKLPNVTIKVLDKKQMEKLNMNLLLNVAAGAAKEPYLLIMEYMNGKKNEKPTVLVGKGVCYDSGGMNLKPASGLTHMKYDMSGGAAVTGTIFALSKMNAKKNVIGIVPLVENMLSGTAQHVDDVWQSMSGQTVEVGNTDAEGRLILADALWYGQEKYKPAKIIDIATLTGVMRYVFADEYAGLFTNDDALRTLVLNASAKTVDKVWELPLNPAYEKMLKSNIADMTNIGGNGAAGSAMAATFLKKFIKKDMPWAHIDMASVCWNDADKPLAPKGATGFGVALLTQIILDNK